MISNFFIMNDPSEETYICGHFTSASDTTNADGDGHATAAAAAGIVVVINSGGIELTPLNSFVNIAGVQMEDNRKR
jgi:hypothetical protein